MIFTIEAFVNRDADTNAYPRICNFGPYYSSNDSIGLQFDDSDHANKITFLVIEMLVKEQCHQMVEY